MQVQIPHFHSVNIKYWRLVIEQEIHYLITKKYKGFWEYYKQLYTNKLDKPGKKIHLRTYKVLETTTYQGWIMKKWNIWTDQLLVRKLNNLSRISQQGKSKTRRLHWWTVPNTCRRININSQALSKKEE